MVDTFTYNPSYSAQNSVKPNIRSVQFGDGYEQRQGNGINTLRQMWTVAFTKRDLSEINAIETFFQTQAGVQYFYWTPPRQSTQLKFICKEWQRTIEAGAVDTITATFTQVFDA